MVVAQSRAASGRHAAGIRDSRGRGRWRVVLRDLRVLYDVGSSVGLTDRQLLERFQSASRVDDHDVAESALTALVERHSAMVWNVCRSLIGDRHDAEDAFQATFLILYPQGRIASGR